MGNVVGATQTLGGGGGRRRRRISVLSGCYLLKLEREFLEIFILSIANTILILVQFHIFFGEV
jgi:hypothetical protein